MVPPLIPNDYHVRLEEILDVSWRIFISRFIGGRHPINIEAPFQHHLANTLLEVGNLYCTSRDDVFFVDLEQKCPDIKGKNKYLDIVCSFKNANVSCAIELKFKTEKQGAQDWGRIDAYVDIEAVEVACRKNKAYSMGRFYMITDSAMYTKPSKKGVGTVFCLHHGHLTMAGTELSYPLSKGRSEVIVQLEESYPLHWQQIGKWHFLEVKIAGLP